MHTEDRRGATISAAHCQMVHQEIVDKGIKSNKAKKATCQQQVPLSEGHTSAHSTIL